jgi:hypothetical protein
MNTMMTMFITELTKLNTEHILPRYCGMDPQVHLCHIHDSFHHNFSLSVEPQVWNQYASVNELHQF